MVERLREFDVDRGADLGQGIYGGIWVGKNSKIPNDSGYRRDVLDALRAIKVPMVRWPGGCFADEYHWRDGVGPRAKRPVKINTNWGGVNENNSFGTNEFMGFVERLGAEAYVSANLGSAPPSETAQWVEYMTSPTGSTLAKERAANGRPAPFPVHYLGLGNELWGCGGNMRAEYAADLTNRYATFAKSGTGTMLKIAAGPSDEDYPWTETLMRLSAKHIDGLALHYYTRPRDKVWTDKGPALGFPESEWASTMQHTLRMDEFITKHSAIMDKYDPEKKKWLVVDEWGTWYDPEPGSNPGFLVQQNSVRDAVVAGLNLNIFARHAQRVKMAASAQMVNVLQAMLLTDGPRMVKTPTYWVFDLYKPWHDATTTASRAEVTVVPSGRGRVTGGQRVGGARQGGAGPSRAGQSRPEPHHTDIADARRVAGERRDRADRHRPGDGFAQQLRQARRGAAGRIRRRDCERRDGERDAATAVGVGPRPALTCACPAQR